MKLKVRKLKSLTNTAALQQHQTPQIAGGKHVDISNRDQCRYSKQILGCTGSACQE
ncbi:hypothetical protein ACSLBF_14775 [Pseudoalteromonas sp. T1lg65]|uniref:hypothetical protein n=1 Tax=Pseudoalteromonas sp. T1lg65 TaxID=2077101 RepID=UPI003F7B2619